ncbi:hypothetical protein GCM10011521_27250 [Arenimonas soli]|uniref:Uncharacterized protein n=1 Tax=Arenimonas soli TaxID=2269504 RepID=A0ABQ1HS39_9GAMM|nr:hypothetical protein [Arenimonas soli]GGA87388.1 hypothetical protein GCM10011521_27250 [Arenimonas soli]
MPGKASQRWMVALAVVAGLALLAASWWRVDQRIRAERRDSEGVREVQAVLEQFRRGLPQEYAPGLMLEEVGFEGQNLVMTIRSLKRRANPDDPLIAQVAQAEKALMLPLCDQPDVLYLLARGVVITRRFIDAENRRFFEITLTSADCAR